ncbi:MAG: electron transfer flavoprotein subunit beta/FixA family protein [Eubacteriaceae bacterium]|nr:electron transfer flavoprotein subunit beta/FixA family protein [Eubacteriaceae bacterium]
MKILVCVKQVPDTEEIKVDPVTGSLIREGVPAILNPLDACALEAAVQFKETYGGNVTVISMGPPQAEQALRQCISVGADDAVLITDRAFKDADTLATSYALSMTAKQLAGFDVIFCGKHTLDGETGQVGPQIAEHLNYNQVTSAMDVKLDSGSLLVLRELEEGRQTVAASLPCVITVTKTNYTPRYPSMKSKMAANRKEIKILSASQIEGLDMDRIGMSGSRTKVTKSFVPQAGQAGMIICEETAEQSGRKLAKLLVDAKII